METRLLLMILQIQHFSLVIILIICLNLFNWLIKQVINVEYFTVNEIYKWENKTKFDVKIMNESDVTIKH